MKIQLCNFALNEYEHLFQIKTPLCYQRVQIDLIFKFHKNRPKILTPLYNNISI